MFANLDKSYTNSSKIALLSTRTGLIDSCLSFLFLASITVEESGAFTQSYKSILLRMMLMKLANMWTQNKINK